MIHYLRFCCLYMPISKYCHEFVHIMAVVVLYVIPHITYALTLKALHIQIFNIHALKTKGDYWWLLILTKNKGWLLILTKKKKKVIIDCFSPLYKVRAHCLNDKFLTSGNKDVGGGWGRLQNFRFCWQVETH